MTCLLKVNLFLPSLALAISWSVRCIWIPCRCIKYHVAENNNLKWYSTHFTLDPRDVTYVQCRVYIYMCRYHNSWIVCIGNNQYPVLHSGQKKLSIVCSLSQNVWVYGVLCSGIASFCTISFTFHKVCLSSQYYRGSLVSTPTSTKKDVLCVCVLMRESMCMCICVR